MEEQVKDLVNTFEENLWEKFSCFEDHLDPMKLQNECQELKAQMEQDILKLMEQK